MHPLLERLIHGAPSPAGEQVPATTRGSVQHNWLPVKDVRDGMIWLRDGSWSIVDEAGSIHLQSLNPEEQDARLGGFRELLQALPFDYSFYVHNLPLRLDEYAKGLARQAETAPPGMAGLLRAQADFAQHMVSGRRVLGRRHYIALRYAPGSDRGARLARRRQAPADPGLAAHILAERRAILHAALKSMSLEARPLDDFALVNLLARTGRDGEMGVAGGTDLRRVEDRLAAMSPGGVEVGWRHLLVERRVASAFTISTWPREGQTGVLDILYHFPAEGCIALHISPGSVEATVERLQHQIMQHTTTMNMHRRAGKPDDPYVAQAMADAIALRDQYASGQNRPLQLQVYATFWTRDLEAMDELIRTLQAELAARMFGIRTVTLQQPAAFFATLPVGQCGPGPWRDLDSRSTAVLLPFTSADLTDAQGILWGKNLTTGSLVLVDDHALPAGHLVVVAATRSGKSYAMKSYATQCRFLGRQVVVIDPSRHEYRRWCQALEGSYVVLGVGAQTRVNPCAILLPPDLVHPDEDDLRPVSSKIEYLCTLITLLVGHQTEGGIRTLTPAERAAAERVLYRLYEEFGMKDDWLCIADPVSLEPVTQGGISYHPAPRAKTMPTFGAVTAALSADPATAGIGEALVPFVSGSLAMFDGQTNVDLNNPLLVFNVRALVEDNPALAPAAYFLLAGILGERLRADRTPKLFLIDEGHNLFKDPAMAQHIERLYRQAAKHGGRVALITQRLADLVGMGKEHDAPPGAQSAGVCLSQSHTRLLMHQLTDREALHCADVFGLAKSETEFLIRASKGQGLLLVDRAHAQIEVQVPPALHELITTDPDELARIEARERAARQAGA